MEFILLALILGFVVCIFKYLTRNYDYWEKQGVPYVKNPLPGVGHLLPVITQRMNFADMCQQFYQRYKDYSMIGFYEQTSPVLLIREPELAKIILQTNLDSFHKNFFELNPEKDPLFSRNPFFHSGEAWMTARKQLTYAFSSMRLKMLADIVQKVGKKFENYIDRKLENRETFEVELKDLFSRYAGEVVANAGLGIEGQCFEDEIKPGSFVQIGKDIFEPTFWKGFLQNLLFVTPFFGRIFGVSFIPQHVDRFFRTMVREILAARKSEKVPRNDFFQLILEQETKEGQPINEEVLAAHALSFFVDGLETSSITLQFAGYHLATNLDIQRKLRNEVKSVLAKHNGAFTYDAVKDMTYMNQVISESQRLEPAFGNLSKVCTQSFELIGSDGLKCQVKPGMKVVINSQSMHKDRRYWTDPDKFDPDRFSEDRKNDLTKYAFLPFGEGPRMCVGMRMGILQVKYGLAILLNKYSFELSPKTRVPLKMDPSYFIRLPVGGVWVNIKPLKE